MESPRGKGADGRAYAESGAQTDKDAATAKRAELVTSRDHGAVGDPGVGIEIAANEGKQQCDPHRFIAAYRRTGGNIQRTHGNTYAVAGPVWPISDT